MVRMWFIPHSGAPYFDNKSVSYVASKYEEGLSISSSLSLLYNINKTTPNSKLSQYGYILSDIPGDAVIVDENGDIDLNIQDNLSEIVREDNEARHSFIESFSETIAHDR